jgi:hypothetical protein
MWHITKRRRPIALLTTVAATTLAATAAATAIAAETPLTTGCPAGYERLAVASLGAPYILPGLVDTAGNNNGYVCGLAQPDAVRDAMCMTHGGNACLLKALGLPRYIFTDDDNPALA